MLETSSHKQRTRIRTPRIHLPSRLACRVSRWIRTTLMKMPLPTSSTHPTTPRTCRCTCDPCRSPSLSVRPRLPRSDPTCPAPHPCRQHRHNAPPHTCTRCLRCCPRTGSAPRQRGVSRTLSSVCSLDVCLACGLTRPSLRSQITSWVHPRLLLLSRPKFNEQEILVSAPSCAVNRSLHVQNDEDPSSHDSLFTSSGSLQSEAMIGSLSSLASTMGIEVWYCSMCSA